MTAAEIAIAIVGDQSDAVAAADATGTAYKQMADDVEAASRTASRGLTDVAGTADDVGGKAGKATGALGALGSGMELLGPSGAAAAAGLQSAALATDFLSGVGDSLNLVLESTILANARARVATIAKAGAEKAAAAATKVMTAGQWLLNAALSANPIGLVVLAVAALVGGFILAYKKSEAFRNIVKTVGELGKKAIGLIVDEFKLLMSVVDTVVTFFKDKVPKAIGTMAGKIGDVADAILKPFQTLKDIIDDIIELIKKIKIPDLPSLPDVINNPFNRTSTAAGFPSPAGGGVTFAVTVNGFIGSPDELVAPLEKAFARAGRRIIPASA